MIRASGIKTRRSRSILWPLPFETLSPIRTVGKESTDLTLMGLSQFESQHSADATGFAFWDSGAAGSIIVRFAAASYGYTSGGTFVFGFTLHAVFQRANFEFAVVGGTLVGPASVSVAANTAATVTATVTNVAADSTVHVILTRVSGGGWTWFQTAIREPGLVVWPPFDEVFSDV